MMPVTKNPAKGKFGGFTLIELLVVVLIIGILAAIALPRYQKAVKRARIAEVKILVKSVWDAQKTYSLSDGNYTPCLNELDTDVLPSFETLTDLDGGVVRAEKGSEDSKIMLDVSPHETDIKNNFSITIWLGNFYYSGNGGYGVVLGSTKENSKPLSCIEYACHAVTEGSFCRDIMGIQTPTVRRDCVRWY